MEGPDVTRKRLTFAGALATAVVSAAGAMAAAIEANDPKEPGGSSPEVVVPTDFELDTELVVHDWVLCVSAASAEAIGRARARGVEEALATYADLKAQKSCGQFPELRVILREAIYRSGPDADRDIRVFGASVNIGSSWPSAFVVYGGLPDQR